MTIYTAIQSLIQYALKNNLIDPEDTVYIKNTYFDLLKIQEDAPVSELLSDTLEEILSCIDNYAFDNGLIAENTTTYRDLFDTRIMGILTARPSAVIHTFRESEKENPEKATDWYYRFSRATDYIRTYRVCKDVRYTVPSVYGDIDITINLSKPEKDPKAIAAAKNAPQAGYPKCVLCRENEGFSGNLRSAARENHRLIPVRLADEDWFLQYSPYVYYNEHCIVLCGEHRPMKIEKKTFERMLDFITEFPHYFIGSNADLPIVGGSILSHDHMQGGHYTFAMERAPIEKELSFAGFPDIEAGIVKWPLSVIRLRTKNPTVEDKKALIALSDKILNCWRSYTDASAFVYAETEGEKHNTITPIARMRNGNYEIDLTLRNNITTKEHPLGVYHPHAEYHNIKKENIGLIEVMGLAVLPARLKTEMQKLADAILTNADIAADETLSKHAQWFASFKDVYTFTKENVLSILNTEIGKTFVHVLEDAGVYKCTEDGRLAMMRFIDSVNQ